LGTTHATYTGRKDGTTSHPPPAPGHPAASPLKEYLGKRSGVISYSSGSTPWSWASRALWSAGEGGYTEGPAVGVKNGASKRKRESSAGDTVPSTAAAAAAAAAVAPHAAANHTPVEGCIISWADPSSGSPETPSLLLDVLVPREEASMVWNRMLTMGAGCAALGLKEWRHCLSIEGHPSFPYDAPDTPAGRDWWRGGGGDFSYLPPGRRRDHVGGLLQRKLLERSTPNWLSPWQEGVVGGNSSTLDVTNEADSQAPSSLFTLVRNPSMSLAFTTSTATTTTMTTTDSTLPSPSEAVRFPEIVAPFDGAAGEVKNSSERMGVEGVKAGFRAPSFPALRSVTPFPTYILLKFRVERKGGVPNLGSPVYPLCSVHERDGPSVGCGVGFGCPGRHIAGFVLSAGAEIGGRVTGLVTLRAETVSGLLFFKGGAVACVKDNITGVARRITLSKHAECF